MTALTLYKTDPVDELTWPKGSVDVTLHSNALNVFTDFEIVKPLVIDIGTTALETKRLMQKAHVRLKLVVDEDKHFLGLVSLNDLNNQELVKRVNKDRKRDELALKDFYRPRDKLMAFDYSDLSRSTLNDVIDTLQRNAQQHCLVIDRNLHKIRGIISASDIARKLNISIDITIDSSFASIFKAVHNA